MISEYYKLIVFIIYFIVFIFAFLEAIVQDKMNKKLSFNMIFTIPVLTLSLILLFGLRDFKIGTDTEMYNQIYINYLTYDFGPDFLMKFLIYGLNIFSSNSRVFLLTISFLYIYSIFFAVFFFSKIFGTNLFLVLFFLLSFFFFYNLGVNVIRQGVSLGFFLLGVSLFFYSKKKKYLFLFFIFSIGFHATSIIPVFIFLLVLVFKNLKMYNYVIIYIFTIYAAFLDFGFLDILMNIDFLLFDTKFNIYLNSKNIDYQVGFRPQFVIFNTIFLFIFFNIICFLKESNHNYYLLLKLYILLSSFFFMSFQIPYSDRFGVMSWILIPILISPLFSSKTKVKLAIPGILFSFLLFLLFINSLNQF